MDRKEDRELLRKGGFAEHEMKQLSKLRKDYSEKERQLAAADHRRLEFRTLVGKHWQTLRTDRLLICFRTQQKSFLSNRKRCTRGYSSTVHRLFILAPEGPTLTGLESRFISEPTTHTLYLLMSIYEGHCTLFRTTSPFKSYHVIDCISCGRGRPATDARISSTSVVGGSICNSWLKSSSISSSDDPSSSIISAKII